MTDKERIDRLERQISALIGIVAEFVGDDYDYQSICDEVESSYDTDSEKELM